MLKRNITKFLAFVIIGGAFSTLFSACGAVSSNNAGADKNVSNGETASNYKPAKILGTIKSDEITESSGLANSPCQPEIIWTHNDSGKEEFVYALDKTGKNLATFKIPDVKNLDWEDMAVGKNAAGKCFLYLGDIGNNKREKSEMTIYKISEPSIAAKNDSDKENPLLTESAEAIKFVYPDKPRDAETLMLHPQTGDIYVVSKEQYNPAEIFKLKANFSADKINILEKISDLTVPAVPNGYVTGGAIAPDGKRAVICDYVAAYEISLPETAKNFDEIWKQKPQKIETGDRKQGEACTYSAAGNAIFLTSEKKDSPLIMIEKK